MFASVESMADDARDNDDRSQPTSDEAALAARFQRLGERLDRTPPRGPSDAPAPRPSTDASAMAQGLRLSTELVAGVVVGGVIGWLLDRWLGISPWAFIVFLLLGFVAGLINLMRSAGVLGERNWKR
jgi:ATP synthase protein I